MTSESTIAAIATPPGTGGIGIIRISGPQALAIFQTLFKPHRKHATLESHKLYYGTITDTDGEVLDEILGVYMKAPLTYTREDVVELHSHGSYLVLQTILSNVLRCGARPAEPGEFTKRAFLAGRVDLTRAEAVIDLLRAKTTGGMQLAVGQLQGKLYEQVEQIRQALINVLAVLEVAIDFPEDDVEILDAEDLRSRLEHRVRQPLVRLIALAEQGKVFRDGVQVVIAGRPNVGKSSLLNGLLREERALVTAVPGTTRDTIEEMVTINGIPVHLVDTAGIRSDAGEVEGLGIERARKKIQQADLVLFLVDPTEPLTGLDRELYASVRQQDHLVVINKQDIASQESIRTLEQTFPESTAIVVISAREHHGLEALQQAIAHKILGDGSLRERTSCAPNVRHRIILEKCLEAGERASAIIAAGISPDLIAIEIQAALDYLGDIVGLTTPDDILDRIFAEFCIGK